MSLEFRIISKEECDRLERAPHNPPNYSENFTPDDFSDEWCAVRAKLKDRLELFGEEWTLNSEQGDFMLSEFREESRWIYITFTSTKLWYSDFIYGVADLLDHLPQDYRVGCLTELDDETGNSDLPVIYLVISSSSVFGKADDCHFSDDGKLILTSRNEALIQFGFPPNAVFTSGLES